MSLLSVAADLMNLDRYRIAFDRDSEPFSPLAQLMGVLPAASAHAMPPALAHMMTDPDRCLPACVRV